LPLTEWLSKFKSLNVGYQKIDCPPKLVRLRCGKIMGHFPLSIKTLCIKNITFEIPNVTKLTIDLSSFNNVKIDNLKKLTIICNNVVSDKELLKIKTAIRKIYSVKIMKADFLEVNKLNYLDTLLTCEVSEIQWVCGVIDMIDCIYPGNGILRFSIKKLAIIGNDQIVVLPNGLEELTVRGFHYSIFLNLPQKFKKLNCALGPIIDIPADILII